MRPASKLFLFPLIILLLFSAAPAVDAQTTAPAILPDFTTAEPIVCGDPAVIYGRSLSLSNEIDVYSIKPVVGQALTIDIDTFDNGETLDTILFVYFDSDPADEKYPETSIASNDNSSDDPRNPNDDPYLEIIADQDGTYYLVIYNALNNSSAGDYTLSLKCTDPSTGPVEPVKVGDLLGATDGDLGSIVNIIPGDPTNTTTTRFPLVTGPITDIEFDPVSGLVYVAVEAVGIVDTVDYIPARIVAIDPNSGDVVESYSLETESVVALEAAADKLYGVRVDSIDAKFSLALVTLVTDTDPKTAKLTDVVSFDWPVWTLAYNQSDGLLYGANGTVLVTIDLALSTAVPDEQGLLGLTSGIATLDFSHEDVLYGVDLEGNLFNVPIFSNREAVVIGDPLDGVNSLTFVINPSIETICSSSFTNQTAASSESASRLTRSRLKRYSRNSAVGLFKFQGEIGDIVNVSVCLEEKMVVESEKASTPSWIQKLWPNWKPKNRIFVVIRDAIADAELRKKVKGVLAEDEALKIKDVQLPATGSYYIMVIRPFSNSRNFDYCLSLESTGGAGESLVVAWPRDESEKSTSAASSAEQKTAEVQKSDDTDDEASSGTGNTTPAEEEVPTP